MDVFMTALLISCCVLMVWMICATAALIAQQRDELLAALEKLCAEVQESGADIVLDEYYAAIAKAKGEKS